MAITDQTRGLTLDLLAWHTQGRVRNSVMSSRYTTTPDAGTVVNLNKVMAGSEVFSVPIVGIASALAIRCSGLLEITVTLNRTPSADEVFMTKCNGMLVLTDAVESVSITNPSSTNSVDVSIVSI